MEGMERVTEIDRMRYRSPQSHHVPISTVSQRVEMVVSLAVYLLSTLRSLRLWDNQQGPTMHWQAVVVVHTDLD